MEHAKKFNAVAQGMAALQNPSTFIFGHSKLPGTTVPTTPVTFPTATPVTSLPQPAGIDFRKQHMQIGQPVMHAPPVVGSFTAMLASPGPLLSPPNGLGNTLAGQTLPVPAMKEPTSVSFPQPPHGSSFSPPNSLTPAHPPVPFTSGQMLPAFTKLVPSGPLASFTPAIGYPSMHCFSQSVM